MTLKPAVSVVMPIYNASPFLRQAMDSVLNQTLENIEVVCVNDGSTDDSLSIMQGYAAKDARIKIIDKPNGGYGHTMNRGIEAACGEFVGILEPDDYILPTMLEKLYYRAVRDDLDFVRSNYNRLTTDDNGIETLVEEKISPKPKYYEGVLNPQENIDLFNIRMENWTGIYRTSFIRKHAIVFNESPGAAFQDNGFWFQSYCWASKIALIDEPFYCYRVDNAASSINQPNKVFTMLDEYQWIESWLDARPELRKRFIGIFEYKKTHNCMFAFSRLAEQFQMSFLERYSNEYKTAYARGDVDESLFWPAELAQLHLIRDNPAQFLEKYRTDQRDADGRDEARRQGKAALFFYYVKNDGLKTAIKKGLSFLQKK
ncbi:MAG: glycosyltransferase [Parolsenella sp.]|uniref:glycosyltransferase n=1 Tax=Parolsenella sp. TaxID=2083006 RepID=UPI002A749D7F|nr:glycosyltransferase [Parolsenella sp.]MCI5950132.1 glycosyltransferase [Coriobacteriaceae bacterium]MDY3292079.1 glycosyltransferase [Parolsenella sp.]